MLTGKMLIGASEVAGSSKVICGVNPATGEKLEPAYGGATGADVARACELAWAAFDTYRETSPEVRAAFLEAAATNILDTGDELIERAMLETGLPRARLEGERGRTVGQLRLFAQVVRAGDYLDARWDTAMPERTPLPRSDLRLRQIAVGPVAVFGASNFPLAFSVAGGDTASALAAGCPVVVKAHSAHPGTSEIVGRAVQAAVKSSGLPEGVFSVLFGSGTECGVALVANPRIQAVGFTGSRGGGIALMETAAKRPVPIPVYAEMSSLNPVLLMKGALAKRGPQLGAGFATSLTMGAGQFCTNPGLPLAQEGTVVDAFLTGATDALRAAAASTMLTPGIYSAFSGGVNKLAGNEKVRTLVRGQEPTGPNQAQASFFETDVQSFIADHALRDEVFGASSLLVRYRDAQDMKALLEDMEGQLTITIHMEEEDTDDVRALLPILERKAGRLLVNGWPTGVEVCHAMVHGGPFPATSDTRTTSVGTLAIRRFLRPVCYQDFPAALLPTALQDANPLGLWRLINGELTKG